MAHASGSPRSQTGTQPPERFDARRLALGTLGGPTATAAAFMANVFLVRADCSAMRVGSRFAVVLAAAAIAAAGVVVTWRILVASREGSQPPTGGAAGRNRFLAFAGLAASAISLLLALYLLGVLAFLDPCLHS